MFFFFFFFFSSFRSGCAKRSGARGALQESWSSSSIFSKKSSAIHQHRQNVTNHFVDQSFSYEESLISSSLAPNSCASSSMSPESGGASGIVSGSLSRRSSVLSAAEHALFCKRNCVLFSICASSVGALRELQCRHVLP